MGHNWADYMDLDARSTLLGDVVCNIEEEEYSKACQHALKGPYEGRTSDEDKGGGKAPSDDDEGSNNKNDSSSDSNSSDTRDGEDDNNSYSDSNNSEDYDSQDSGSDWGEPPSDREDEDVGLFYEDHSNNDVDYYHRDIEDDAKAEPINMENGTESEEYELENVLEGEEFEEANNIDYDDYPNRQPLDWSYIIDGSLRLGPQYKKHGKEILELRSFHNSELGSLTPYTEEEDDIDARLATLDKKLMIHNFRDLTLESLEDEDKKVEGNELEYPP